MPDDEYEYDESALKIAEEPAPHVVERKPIITPKSTPSKTFYATTAQK